MFNKKKKELIDIDLIKESIWFTQNQYIHDLLERLVENQIQRYKVSGEDSTILEIRHQLDKKSRQKIYDRLQHRLLTIIRSSTNIIPISVQLCKYGVDVQKQIMQSQEQFTAEQVLYLADLLHNVPRSSSNEEEYFHNENELWSIVETKIAYQQVTPCSDGFRQLQYHSAELWLASTLLELLQEVNKGK